MKERFLFQRLDRVGTGQLKLRHYPQSLRSYRTISNDLVHGLVVIRDGGR